MYNIKKLFLALTAVLALTANADSIYVVTTAPPGGVPDTVARQVMQHYDKLYLGTITTPVFNRPGAEGQIGVRQFINESVDKDGVLFPASGHMASLDPREYDQLVPLVEIAKQPMVFVVRNNFPARNWEEFIAYSKTRPGEISVAVISRALTMPGALRIAKNNGIDLNYITYNNSAFYTDLYSGIVDGAWVPASSYFGGPTKQYARALVVAGQKNIIGIPNELSYGNDKKVGEWYISQGIFVSKTMPDKNKKLLQSRFNNIIHNHWGKEFQIKNPGVILGNTDPVVFEKTLLGYRKDWDEIKSTIK